MHGTIHHARMLRHRRAGLSMVHVLVAVVILAIALLGTVAAIMSAGQLDDATRRLQTAEQTARSLIEEARVVDFRTLPGSLDGVVRPVPELDHGATKGTATYRVTEEQPGGDKTTLYRVTVEVVYEGKAGPVTVSMSTICVDR